MWNSHFEALTPQDGFWKLTFKNGLFALADLVIAADGANSRIRPYITPVKPFYTGVTVVEGTVYHSETASPQIHKLLNGGKIFAMGDDKLLVVSSKVMVVSCSIPAVKPMSPGVAKQGSIFPTRHRY